MDRQLDAEAAAALVRGLGALGIAHRVGARTEEVVTHDGRLRAVRLSGPVDSASSGDELLPADLLVLATGTIPEADLAGAAGLTVRRGVVVGDDGATSDPSIFAIGDCAEPPEGATGLIAQGWDQARRLARRLADSWSADEAAAAGSQTGRPLPALRRSADEAPAPGKPDDLAPAPGRPDDLAPAPGRPADQAPAPTRPAEIPPAPPAAAPVMPAHGTDVVRLKAYGLEVVTMGDPGEADADDARVVRLSEPRAGRHVEVVVRQGVVVAATCVGGGQVAADLVTAYTRRTPAPRDPAQLLLRPVTGSHQDGAGEPSPTLMPDRATVCRCNGVTKGDIVACWEHGARTAEDVARATRATTGCGGCTEAVCGLVDWLARSDPPGQPAAAAAAPVAPTAAAPTAAAEPTAAAAVTVGASR
jgi:assimilatory nitrate reductase electron transfer subunit